MTSARHRFMHVLLRATEQWQDRDLEALNGQLRSAFLEYASETPDNLTTAESLSLGQARMVGEDASVQGLVLERLGVPLSELLWHAFGEAEIPESVSEAYPSLTREEWNQTLRIAQMVLSALEREKPVG